MRETLALYVRGAMKKCYEAALPVVTPPPVAAGQLRVAFPTSFLLLGFGSRTAYFLEVAADGQLNWHHDSKFYAVGSGGDFATVAHALMAHYLEGPSLTIEQGLRLAHRTIETTCTVDSAGDLPGSGAVSLPGTVQLLP